METLMNQIEDQYDDTKKGKKGAAEPKKKVEIKS
jgi:hypothetical protein